MRSYIYNYPMFKLADLVRKLYCKLVGINEKNWDNEDYKQKEWVTDGVNCEVLNISEGKWKKGKLRIQIRLEFCFDEPSASQSPLDDLR